MIAQPFSFLNMPLLPSPCFGDQQPLCGSDENTWWIKDGASFFTAHTFCASRVGLRNSNFFVHSTMIVSAP